jgi:hypothetical protein
LLDGGRKAADSLIQIFPRFAVTCIQTPQIDGVGAGIAAVAIARVFDAAVESLLKRLGDLLSNLVLHFENIVQVEVIFF